MKLVFNRGKTRSTKSSLSNSKFSVFVPSIFSENLVRSSMLLFDCLTLDVLPYFSGADLLRAIDEEKIELRCYGKKMVRWTEWSYLTKLKIAKMDLPKLIYKKSRIFGFEIFDGFTWLVTFFLFSIAYFLICAVSSRSYFRSRLCNRLGCCWRGWEFEDFRVLLKWALKVGSLS